MPVINLAMQPAWTGDDKPSGTYIYSIHAKDGDDRGHDYKGTVMLVR